MNCILSLLCVLRLHSAMDFYVHFNHHYEVAENAIACIGDIRYDTTSKKWLNRNGEPVNIHKMLVKEFGHAVKKVYVDLLERASAENNIEKFDNLRCKASDMDQLYEKLQQNSYRNKIICEMQVILDECID